MRVMFIDPGVAGTGWAYWANMQAMSVHFPVRGETQVYTLLAAKERNYEVIEATPPTLTGSLLPTAFGKKMGWAYIANDIAMQILDMYRAFDIEYVGIENPELWSGSATSQAAGTKGNLGKLSYLVGCLSARCVDHNATIPFTFSPKSWKGQLPKDVVLKRIERYWPQLAPRNHEGDAIGMGLHFLGGM